jgi:hypothetical protein
MPGVATGRQPTPSSTVGVLSNAGVRLDERLDLIDFLEDPSTNGGDTLSATGPSPVGQRRLTCTNGSGSDGSIVSNSSSGNSSPSGGPAQRQLLSKQRERSAASMTARIMRRQNSRELMAEHWETPAAEVARIAELSAARNVLQDELPQQMPWFLQALFCFSFPCFGVEGTMRTCAPLMPRIPRLKLEECLSAIDRHSENRPSSFSERRR